MPDINETMRREIELRDAVVQAALAERRAQRQYNEMMSLTDAGGSDYWHGDVLVALDKAGAALQKASDALLEFLGDNDT